MEDDKSGRKTFAIAKAILNALSELSEKSTATRTVEKGFIVTSCYDGITELQCSQT